MEKVKEPYERSTDNEISAWFEKTIQTLRTDEMMLELGIATQEKKDMYSRFFKGNPDELMSETRTTSTKHFIKKLLIDYLTFVLKAEIKPIKLYADFNASQVLIWAEIEDNDEATEYALYKAEGQANALNYDYGFHISSTIVEKCDCLQTPKHYIELYKFQ